MTHPLYDTRLDQLEISVFDLETTGLYASHDRIIQVAVVPIDGGSLSNGEWETYVNPGSEHLPLKDIIIRLTGIKDADLVGAPDMAQTLRAFDDRVGTRIVAGHNIRSFDLKFMRKAEQRHGIDVQLGYYIDTLILMRKLHPDLPNHKLSTCGDFYNIDYDENDLHNALADTRLTAQVLLAQIAELDAQGVHTFGDMLNFVS